MFPRIPSLIHSAFRCQENNKMFVCFYYYLRNYFYITLIMHFSNWIIGYEELLHIEFKFKLYTQQLVWCFIHVIILCYVKMYLRLITINTVIGMVFHSYLPIILCKDEPSSYHYKIEPAPSLRAECLPSSPFQLLAILQFLKGRTFGAKEAWPLKSGQQKFERNFWFGQQQLPSSHQKNKK